MNFQNQTKPDREGQIKDRDIEWLSDRDKEKRSPGEHMRKIDLKAYRNKTERKRENKRKRGEEKNIKKAGNYKIQ